jgi:hypothetical protein
MEFRNMITGALITPTDWQLALKVGDCYEIANSTGAVGDGVRFQIFDMPTIVGELIEAAEPGYFYARGYSADCPDGEIGLVCICDPTRKLSRAEFEAALAGLTE